ncbi:MAG TPA: carboxypeptidase-like regulatory domain-containing protein, partial [Bryobacteraceae bacterium]|nr:carboxypeptidase-like regulatory domain-containing protein [Bryobacteraceae bacterium]
MRVLALLILAAAVLAQTPGLFAPNGVLTGRLGAAPPNQQPPAHSDCAADGSVVNSITREPIVRAHVTINAGGTSYTTATDSSGKWAMANLGCAPGQLTVTRPGFLNNNGINR